MTKDHIPTRPAKVLLIGHDPRLQKYNITSAKGTLTK